MLSFFKTKTLSQNDLKQLFGLILKQKDLKCFMKIE